MSNDSVEKSFHLIPEVAHDFIARIVPGAFILATSVKSTPFDINDHPILSAFGITLLAYVIGFILDWLTVPFATFIEHNVFITWPALKGKHDKLISPKDIVHVDEISDASKRTLAIKLLSETVLCQTLCFYFLFQTFISFHSIRKFIKIILFGKTSETFQSTSGVAFYRYPWTLCAALFCLMMFVYFLVSRHAIRRCYNLKHDSSKGSSKPFVPAPKAD